MCYVKKGEKERKRKMTYLMYVYHIEVSYDSCKQTTGYTKLYG